MKIRIITLSSIFFVTSMFAIKHPTSFTTLNECIQNGSTALFLLEESGSHQFVLSLEKGIVVNEGGIVTADGKILTDTETYKQDQQRLLNGTRDIAHENPIYFDGTLAVISSPGQQCYFHWLLQVIPRLKILKESNLSYDKIYIFGHNFKHRWQQDSLYSALDHLDIPRDRLFLANESTVVEAKKLLVPSVPWKPSDPKFWNIGLIPWYKKFFDDVFVKQSKEDTPKRIFISRSKANYRRISNENNLMESLSKKGFVSFHLEDLSLSEQATLFNNAEIIIGPHGAGWTNLIFCKPGTHIIEIDHGLKGENQRSSFKGMVRRMGCFYHPFYVGLLEATDHPEDVLAPINQDLTVDLALFEQFCQQLDIL